MRTKTVEINGWVLRVRAPASDPAQVILLLHGWTGDEGSMWVFAHRLPKNALVFAPRGLYTTPLGGFGWHPFKPKAWPWVDDFIPAIEALENLLHEGQLSNPAGSALSLVGFSQGAALAYAYAMLKPQRIVSLAGLSGFLPDGAEALARNKPLSGKRAFIAHGTQDELVPVWRARRAVELLGSAGALVTYCESEAGHKLGTACSNGLEAFFKANDQPALYGSE